MTSQIIPVDPFDFIIFGGTGDLSERKLLPSLYHRQRDHQFSEPTRIIGTSRSKMSDEEFRAFAKQGDLRTRQAGRYRRQGTGDVPGPAVLCLGRRDDRRRLRQAEEGDRRQRPHPRLLPGGCAGAVRRHLAQAQEHKLITPNSRIVVEKPIGRDLASARALNDLIGERLRRKPDLPHRPLSRQGDGAEPDGAALCQRALRAAVELRPYRPRADHRGRDRSASKTASPTTTRPARCATWCRTTSCSCSASSPWKRPSSMDADAVRDEKLKVLRALKRINGNEAPKHDGARPVSRRRFGRRPGQGLCRGARQATATPRPSSPSRPRSATGAGPAFRSTCAPASGWPSRVSEIVIEFKPIPHSIFGDSAGPIFANQLVIRLQPDEGVKQFIMIKDPGPGGMRLRQISLDMSFAQSFDGRSARCL